MAYPLSFFDMSVSVTPPNGYLEPVPVSLGPNWQPNDVRLLFVTASGASGGMTLEMQMHPDPPTGFAKAFSLNPGYETHGVYYRRLATGDLDTGVAWAKPSGWQHFMVATITARGVSPTVNPTAGWLRINQTGGDSTAVAQSVTVPSAGTMVFVAGNVPTPWAVTPEGSVAVSMGAPVGWTNLVATDKSGGNFYPYGVDPSLIVVARTFTAAGSTGAVAFPTAQGAPAFTGLYVFLTAASDVTVTVGAV